MILRLICHIAHSNFSSLILKLEFLFIETGVSLYENEMKLPSYAAK